MSGVNRSGNECICGFVYNVNIADHCFTWEFWHGFQILNHFVTDWGLQFLKKLFHGSRFNC